MISSFYYDKGDFAPSQQDALVLEVLASGRREIALLAVCDGISGLEEGEYASSYVTMRIRNWFYDSCLKQMGKQKSRRKTERSCTRMLYDCNRYLQLYGKERGIRLGTTMTMALLQRNGVCRNASESRFSGNGFLGRRIYGWLECLVPVRYTLFHAGDCRGYRIGRTCRKLTNDDSSAGHALARCIGSFPWQGVQRRRGFLFGGGRLLLCSDGFWRRLENGELADSLGTTGRLSGRRALTEGQLSKRLGKLGQTARARGEKDNQSAVICGYDVRRLGK